MGGVSKRNPETSTLAVSETDPSKEEEDWPGPVSPAGCMVAAEMPEADSAARCECKSDADAEAKSA